MKAEEKKRHIEVKKQKKEFLQGGCGAFKSMKTTNAALLRRNHQGFAEDKILNTEKGVKNNMGNVIRKSLKKKKSSTNSVSAAVISAENDTTAVMSTAAEGMTSDQNN